MSFRFDRVKLEYYESIKEFRNEFIKYDSEFDGCNQLKEYEDIEKWDLNCKLFENKDTLPPMYPLSYQYLYLDNNEVIGMLNFRPDIEQHIFYKLYGGHIGYSVKPSRRNSGVGSMMLHDFLDIAGQYGLNRVMVSCMSSNEASRKIIVKNGGEFDGEVLYPPKNEMLQRYWIKL